jgi:predicted ATPase with chaperone activity
MNLKLTNPIQGSRRVMAHPTPPSTIEETGLDLEFLVQLLCKTMYRMGLQKTSEMAEAMKVPVPIVETLIADMNDKKLVEMLGQQGANLVAEMKYALTSRGREWALEALAQSEWVGPVPVPLEQFQRQARAQSIRGETLTRPMLADAFRDLTLADTLMEQVGPAVNSGQSMLLYGPPGNGKSSIAEAICEAYRDYLFMPYAISVDRQIITLYDPTVHRLAETEQAQRGTLRHERTHDARYVPCKRPIVITGGELSLDMLDLAYSPVSRTYEAPMQLKAAGGILVVDDFGRQRQSPQEIVNRLIVPLEKNVDYLSLQTGRKFDVPFDALVIISTNIPPRQLVDDAALRRLRYKIYVGPPEIETYIEIFSRAAEKFGLELTEDVLSFVLFELYEQQPDAEHHAFHPRFLIEQTLAICTYEGVQPELRPDFLRRAWANLYTHD